MGKSNYTPDQDIAEEKYHGPNEAVAGFGYGAVETKFGWLIGLLAGGVLAFFNYKRFGSAIKIVQDWAHGIAENGRWYAGAGEFIGKIVGKGKDNVTPLVNECISLAGQEEAKNSKAVGELIKRYNESKSGGFVHALSDELAKFVDWVGRGFQFEREAHHFNLKDFIGQGLDATQKEQKINAIMLGGGLSSLIGMAVATVMGGKEGVDRVRGAKTQLNRAQDEIVALRKQHDEVLQRYLENQRELETQKATAGKPDDGITVAQDNPVTRTEGVDVNTAQKRGDEPQTAINAATVQNGWPPDIEAPRVKDPHFPQDPKMPWGDKNASAATQNGWPPDIEAPRVKDPHFPQEPRWPWGDKVREQQQEAAAQPATPTVH